MHQCPVSVVLEEYYRINVVVGCWQSGESDYPSKSACLTSLQSIQTDFLKMICYGGTKIQSTNFVQRNVKNIKRRIFLFLQKNSKNYAKSVYFLQFAFNNQNFAQTKEQICSRVSPLLETLYPKDFNKYLPQDCINSPASGKAFCRKQSRGSAYERDVSQKEISRSVALGLHRNYL